VQSESVSGIKVAKAHIDYMVQVSSLEVMSRKIQKRLVVENFAELSVNEKFCHGVSFKIEENEILNVLRESQLSSLASFEADPDDSFVASSLL